MNFLDRAPGTPAKVLVTGAAGYLGSVLCAALRARGFWVSGLDKRAPVEKAPGFLLHTLRTGHVAPALFRGFDYVVHLAALSNDACCEENASDVFRENSELVRDCAEAARASGVKRFIFASSCSVYGVKAPGVISDESAETLPQSTYAESKLRAEELLSATAGPGFSVVCLRFATLFGWSPRLRTDLVINRMIGAALSEEPIVINGSGQQERPFLHVDDACAAIVTAFEAPLSRSFSIYNVTHPQMNLSILEVAKRVSAAFPSAAVEFSPARADTRSYLVSGDRFERESGFLARVNLERAVSEFVSHRATPPCPEPKIGGMVLAYNCGRLLRRADQRIPHELLSTLYLMDDGSTDDTSQVASSLGWDVLRSQKNHGYGGNLKRGLAEGFARGMDYVVEIHGDAAQFDPQALRQALPYLRAGSDLILGSRFRRPGRALANGMPLIRFIANRLLSWRDRFILRVPLTEFHTGFRIYSRRLYETLSLENNSDDYLFSFEIISQAIYHGLRIDEIEVEADYHAEHTSHSLWGATRYAFQTCATLFHFVLARHGFRFSGLYPRREFA